MNTLKKMMQISLSTAAIALCILLMKPLPANAATSFIKSLSNYDTIYYDVTGDGKMDRISREFDNSDVIIKLNGETVFNPGYDDESASVHTYVGVLKNKTAFIILEVDMYSGDRDNDHSKVFFYQLTKSSGKYVYKYVNTMSRVLDCSGDCSVSLYDSKIKGNTIYLDYSYYSRSLGHSVCRYTYTYKKGKLERSSNTGAIIRCDQKSPAGKDYSSRKFTLNKKIKVYKSTSGKKKIMTIKKGKKVRVDKITYSKKKGTWVRIKYKKRSGWIKVPGNKTNIFKNVFTY